MKGFNVDGQLRKLPSGYLFIMIFFLLPSFACCQSYSVRHFGIRQGLPTSQIKSLIKDELGYLWIGTHGGGLVRFDGNEFITYTTRDGLVNNYITKMCRDSENNIWIGTLLGISKFNGVSFSTIDLNFGAEPTPKQKMIRQIITYQGCVYALNYSGQIGKAEGTKMIWINNSQPARFIALDNSGGLYYHSFNNELVDIKDQSSKILLPNNLKMTEVIMVGLENRVNTNKGLFKIENGKFVREFHRYNTGPLVVDLNDGIIWDMNDQLVQLRLDQQPFEIQRYPEITQITSYVQDEGSELWIGSYTQGLFNIKKRSMEKIFSVDLHDVIMAIDEAPDHSYWFGAFGNGLLKYDPITHRLQRHFFQDDLRKNFVTSLRQVGSKTWFGTYGGLAVYEKNQIDWIKDAQGNDIDSVLSLDIDNKGEIWVGRADKGIEKIAGSTILHIPFPGKAALSVRYLSADSTLYIGTFQGIYTYHGDEVRKLDTKPIEVGLARSLDIFRENYLVAATENDGVLLYNVLDGTILTISVEDGLLSPMLSFVKVENDFIWVGSVRGINRIRLDDDLKVVEVLCFNEMNGLDGIEANSNSFFINGDLKLFGSSDGVYKYVDFNGPKLLTGKLHLQDVKLFYGAGQSRAFSDSVSGFFKIPYNPTFSASDNHLTFQFNAVNTSLPGLSLFTYRLENFDQQWSQRSGRNEVTYSSLPPGEYVFKVRLTDAKTKGTVEELSYPFSISPPFYRKAWFVTFIGLSAATAFVLIFRSQVRRRVHRMLDLANARAEENHRLRQEIARDFHDEMGNHLVIVSSHVNLLLMESNDPLKTDILHRIENSIRYINLRTRDFVWAINPSHNNLDDLFLYLRDFAEGLFKNSKIVFRAENNVPTSHAVTYKFSRETILIFKEIFTNALKHSNAMNVYFRLTASNFQFAMEVSDDGVGIKGLNWSNGGLSNMTFRANKIGAGLLFFSRENEGTRIGLNFKLEATKTLEI